MAESDCAASVDAGELRLFILISRLNRSKGFVCTRRSRELDHGERYEMRSRMIRFPFGLLWRRPKRPALGHVRKGFDALAKSAVENSRKEPSR